MALNYQDMVHYVNTRLNQIEEHMSAHDKWHLQNLQASKNLIIIQGLMVLGLIADIIVQIALHK